MAYPMGPDPMLAGSSPLDQPPPSPTPMGGGGFAGLAEPMPLTANQLPPELLTGLMQTAEEIDKRIDAIAQAAPDLSNEFSLIKDMIRRTMAKLLVAGSPTPSPTAPGRPFPGGGMAGGGMV